ncbi:MAG TPA: sigma-70 family RNA polymerase sigma factor [Bryobacteraceae bacterium]
MSSSVFKDIIERIQAGDPTGAEQLVSVVSSGMRSTAQRSLRGAADVDDVLQAAFLEIFDAIGKGAIREPERLAGFIQIVVRRKARRAIRMLSQSRGRFGGESAGELDRRAADPIDVDAGFERDERMAALRNALLVLPPREREILTRFYVSGEDRHKIQQEMGLSDTQFRLLKNRAKNHAERLTKTKMGKGPEHQF